jgi:hypothetical protein
MLAKVTSCAVVGLDALPIEVEVDMGRGRREQICPQMAQILIKTSTTSPW